MGIRATIYEISPEAYSTAALGDSNFELEGKGRDLDKAWHAIHYLVTGDASLKFLKDGIQLPDVSETVEAHSPQAIAELAQQFTATSADDLLGRYNADDFNIRSIYSGVWDQNEATYLRGHLIRFMEVVRDAAQRGNGILVVLA